MELARTGAPEQFLGTGEEMEHFTPRLGRYVIEKAERLPGPLSPRLNPEQSL